MFDSWFWVFAALAGINAADGNTDVAVVGMVLVLLFVTFHTPGGIYQVVVDQRIPVIRALPRRRR